MFFKNHSSIGFFDKIAHLLLSEKKIIVCRSNNMQEYSISRWLILFIYSFFVLCTLWTVSITYMYFFNSDSFFDKTDIAEEYKEKYKKSILEVNAYKDLMKVAASRREKEYKALINLLEKSKTITKQDKIKYMHSQSLAIAEVNFLSDKLDDYLLSNSLRKIDIADPYYKLAKVEIQRDVAWMEKQNIKKDNDKLIKISLSIKEAQNKLLDKVEVLAKNNLKDIEGVISKLNRSFTEIGLLGRDKLLAQASKIDNGFGGPFVPIEKVNIMDNEINNRYKTINKIVDTWDGLLKVRTILPIGYPSESKYITSGFGEREDPFLKVPAMHRGIDFRGKIGSPLFTTAPGKVIRANSAHDYGLFVEVDHGMGFTTVYAHLSKILVNVGDQLNVGDTVGLAGSTGRSTGPHLHYEVRYKKRPINPYSFVIAGD